MINSVNLIGHVGSVTLPKTDKQPLKMSLATPNIYIKDGKTIKDTDWHTIVVFSPKMKKIYQKHIGVGSQIFVSGKLRSSKSETSDKTYYNYSVHADQIEFLNLKDPE